MPEQTLSLANFGPYAIAITSLIAAIAAIIAICNTNKQNNKNRLHDKELKHHEFILDKFEEIHKLVLDTRIWIKDFYNFQNGKNAIFIVMPFPESLAKARLIANLYFPALEDELAELGKICDLIKKIYFLTLAIIEKVNIEDQSNDTYWHLIEIYGTIYNAPSHILFASLASQELRLLYDKKLTSIERSIIDKVDSKITSTRIVPTKETELHKKINNLHALVSRKSNDILLVIQHEAKQYSSNFTTTMEKEALKDKAWRKAIISFFKRKRKKP
ncbi:hypothetical protein [Sessilibacter sp. MAH2]